LQRGDLQSLFDGLNASACSNRVRRREHKPSTSPTGPGLVCHGRGLYAPPLRQSPRMVPTTPFVLRRAIQRVTPAVPSGSTTARACTSSSVTRCAFRFEETTWICRAAFPHLPAKPRRCRRFFTHKHLASRGCKLLAVMRAMRRQGIDTRSVRRGEAVLVVLRQRSASATARRRGWLRSRLPMPADARAAPGLHAPPHPRRPAIRRHACASRRAPASTSCSGNPVIPFNSYKLLLPAAFAAFLPPRRG